MINLPVILLYSRITGRLIIEYKYNVLNSFLDVFRIEWLFGTFFTFKDERILLTYAM